MSVEFALPQMGFDMTEAKIARWNKHEGDRVAPGDVLAEVATEKVNLELVDHPGGVIEKILVPEGETVPVGTPIVRFGETAGASAAQPAPQAPQEPAKQEPAKQEPAKQEAAAQEAAAQEPAAAEPSTSAPREEARSGKEPFTGERGGEAPPVQQPPPDAPPREQTTTAGASPAPPAQHRVDAGSNGAGEAPPSSTTPRRLNASPLARKIAQEKGVDLGEVKGSGPMGRILRDDVLQAAESTTTRKPGSAPAPEAPTPITTAPLAAAAGPVELSPMRQAIARRMQESKQQIPHFYLTGDIRMDAVLQLRAELKRAGGEDVNITINDVVMKAVALALTRRPEMNAWFVEGKVRVQDRVNLGIAVPLEEGLVVPAILDCQHKSLGQIAAASRELVARARKGSLKAEEFTGGTFTVSNLGMFGVDAFQAIINPPQVGILAVGAARKQPVVENDTLIVGTVMQVCLSCDHRVIDGVAGAQFLAEIRRLLENPMLMLL